MADLLHETSLNDEQKHFVDVFRSAGENLLSIINDILDFSKIESGGIILEKTDYDIDETIEKTCDVLAVRAHEKKVELIHDVDSGVPARLIGDPLRIRQILTNLVGNSIKFTENGEIVLRVRVNSLQNGEAELLFSVSDTGVGIPQDKLEAIFERFTQADSSTTRRFGGTGLGLSIVKHLVEMMGGRIWVDSKVGHGSTFFFTIKTLISQNIASSLRSVTADLKGMKVLVVDDNQTNRFILSRFLSSWGAYVVEADSAYTAIASIKSAKEKGDEFKLVMLDKRMPSLDGFEVAKFIKENPNLKSTVLIMLTSDDKGVDAIRAKEIGIETYLVKPVKRMELVKEIKSALLKETSTAVCDDSSSETCLPTEMKPLKILLAEDSKDNIFLIKAYLKNTPFNIDIAENGMEAFEKVKTNNYNLILMDMQMPVMDGFEATRQIRKREASLVLGHIPVIALTAFSMEEDRKKTLDAGCDEYLTKPIKKAKLLENIIKFGNIGNRIKSVDLAEIVIKGDIELKEIIPGFIVHVKEDVETLRKLANDLNYENIRTIGHQLKGSGGGYGFDKVTDIGQAMQAAAESKDLVKIKKLIDDLESYMSCVRVVY